MKPARAWSCALWGILTVALFLSCGRGAQAEVPAQPLRAVWVLAAASDPKGIPLEPFTAYLASDLRSHGLDVSLKSVSPLPLQDEDLPPWIEAQGASEFPLVLVSLRHDPSGLSNHPDVADILLITLRFPESGLRLERQVSFRRDQPPALAPLAAITASMLLSQIRPATSGLPSAPEPDTPRAEREGPSPPPAIQEPEALTTDRRNPPTPPPCSRLGIEIFPTWQVHPHGDTHLLGATFLLAYSPQSPLSMLIGGSVLGDVSTSHSRYRFSLLSVPLVAGIRLEQLRDAHRVGVDAGVLAHVTRADFSDNLRIIPDTHVTRLNVGFLAALGYTWYPLRCLGVGGRLALGFTPRVQSYRVDGEQLAAPGAWFLQLGLGLDWVLRP